MKERKVWAYKNYFLEFIKELSSAQLKKVEYVLDMLKTQDRVNVKFVKYLRNGLYEIRINSCNEALRVFFIFDDDSIVVLFNGIHKKTQKTSKSDIEQALRIKAEYYEWKK